MTAVMLATYPEVFAGGAVIAGLPYGAATGMNQALGAMRRVPELSARAWGDKVRAAAPPPASWPRIAVWHGDADTTVTPGAGQALALQWCDVHGVTRSQAVASAGAGHTGVTWLRPDGGVAVELHRVAGLGHGTPSSARGEDGCGTPRPWILEAGVASSPGDRPLMGAGGSQAHRHAGRGGEGRTGEGQTHVSRRFGGGRDDRAGRSRERD